MRNSLLASTVFALAATNVSEATLISFSQIITNNTASIQSYEIIQSTPTAINSATAGMRGSLSIVLTDFNRDGATLQSDGGNLYRAWANSTLVRSAFVPPSGFLLTALPRGMASSDNYFGTSVLEPMSPSLGTINSIEMRWNFRLSAGDQVAIAGTFEVASVPTPASAAILICSAISARRRRR
jgi:hypothetical protein